MSLIIKTPIQVHHGLNSTKELSQQSDITAAFLWYENNRIGLGYDFLLQIDAGFHFITRNPNAHNNGYAGTKMHLIKRFPYKIIYIIDKTNIRILAVLHNRRDPKTYRKRISDQ